MERGIRRILPIDNDGADGASQIYVTRSGQVLGAMRIADVLRPEAKHAVRAMRRIGLKVFLLSGDSQAVATRVGIDLGVDEAIGELLPQDKATRVRHLRHEGRNVAMLGDGINDAPALVEANVGIAMGSGTDVARESADVILIGNDLSKFVETLQTARNCRRVIMQNFVGTLAVDSVGVAMAAFGMLNPLLAAFIHVASELTFILNSTRLLPRSS
jgi:Cd2+/Zn2+-exporting ATPase/Cu+-exporting ATPase